MHHLDLVSHWRLRAPPQHVWAALADIDRWSRWWSCVQAVRTLEQGAADGVGCVWRIDGSTRLPLRISFDMQVIESVPNQLLRVRWRGALQGDAIWLLAADGVHTDITCVWRVNPQPTWMRRMAPLLAPLYRWNHASVMRAGQTGLEQWLARPVVQPVRP